MEEIRKEYQTIKKNTMSWATLLKAGGKAAKWVGKGTKAAAETAGKAMLHPQQTIKGAGSAVKTAAVGGGLGYVGWKKLTTDDSVAEIVSDAIIGEKGTQKISDTLQGASDGLHDIKESVGNMSESVSSAMGNVEDKVNGVSNFLGNMSSGNGGEMMGGFLNNVVKGNVSGLGITGLVLSAFLLFGRFGWMGKIAGALMAMMTIGNNSSVMQNQTSRQIAGATATGQSIPETEIQSAQDTEQSHISIR